MAIVVCVPFIKPHPKFLPHFIEWYAANKADHDLKLAWGQWKALHQVQARAVLLARSVGASHILFTEDDQWGFPVDGIEVLLDADKDVVGFATYSRRYPFTPFNMRKKDPAISLLTRERNVVPFYRGDGPDVQPCDLVSWAFTLVRTDVFDRIADPFTEWGLCPTDSAFCQACLDAGVQPHVHFATTIAHGDFGPEEVPFRRRMYEMMASSNVSIPSEIADPGGFSPSLSEAAG